MLAGSLIEELKDVISASGLAEAVYIAMAGVSTSLSEDSSLGSRKGREV
jgi:hypothetical protein